MKDLYVDGVAYTYSLGFGTTAMTLPTADGSANQVLKTDGSGTLSWTNGGGASAIDDLTDGKSGGTGFTGSVLLGHETTGTLNDAQYNTAVGLTALDAVTEGDDNTAVGYNALTGATTGSKNVAVGKGAMTAAVTGEGNMAVGYNSLNSLTSGGGNVAIGRQVLSKVEGGSKNVGIGRQAGIQIVAGDVGGTSLVSGSQNTYIGAETVPSAANATNETVIGQGATGGGNNSVTLGNTSNESVFISSTVSTKPLVELKNTTNDANSGILKLVKDKGAAGADGDNIGILEFVGDDAAQTQTSFAKIVAEVSEADDTDEAG